MTAGKKTCENEMRIMLKIGGVRVSTMDAFFLFLFPFFLICFQEFAILPDHPINIVPTIEASPPHQLIDFVIKFFVNHDTATTRAFHLRPIESALFLWHQNDVKADEDRLYCNFVFITTLNMGKRATISLKIRNPNVEIRNNSQNSNLK